DVQHDPVVAVQQVLAVRLGSGQPAAVQPGGPGGEPALRAAGPHHDATQLPAVLAGEPGDRVALGHVLALGEGWCGKWRTGPDRPGGRPANRLRRTVPTGGSADAAAGATPTAPLQPAATRPASRTPRRPQRTAPTSRPGDPALSPALALSPAPALALAP